MHNYSKCRQEVKPKGFQNSFSISTPLLQPGNPTRNADPIAPIVMCARKRPFLITFVKENVWPVSISARHI